MRRMNKKQDGRGPRQKAGEIFVPPTQRQAMKAERKSRGWTTKEAGLKSGVSQGTISNFERNVHETVSIEFFARYYRALYGREETLSQTTERLRSLTENLSRLDEKALSMVDAVVASLLDAQHKT